MKLKEPQAKKRFRVEKSDTRVPIPTKSQKIRGHYNGCAVVIADQRFALSLNTHGGFGSSNLSRGFTPNANDVPIIRRRVFERRKGLLGDGKMAAKRKAIVVPDSESDDESNYFDNLKPAFELLDAAAMIANNLHLGLEEAFFLAFYLELIDIDHANAIVSKENCYALFAADDRNFPLKFLAYYYFRARNWIVKPGLKFGGDFLLYKQGPQFFHASYVVVVQVLDAATLREIEGVSWRSCDVIHLLNLQRVCESARKEILLCQLLLPSNHTHLSIDEQLEAVTTNVTLLRRHNLESMQTT